MDTITAETRGDSLQMTLPRKQQAYADILGIIGFDSLTAVEIAARIGKPVYQVRPRLTELLTDGLIHTVCKKWSDATGRYIAVYRRA